MESIDVSAFFARHWDDLLLLISIIFSFVFYFLSDY